MACECGCNCGTGPTEDKVESRTEQEPGSDEMKRRVQELERRVQELELSRA